MATIISSYTVKYILPYLSEFLFRKIGFGAMVISGIILFIGTSEKIIQQDKISIISTQKESAISWRNTDFVFEFAFDEGFEIERSIHHDELPTDLKEKFKILKSQYDTIHLEKVFRFRKEPTFEFYCYKDNKLTKLEM